jgi:exopolyphosphatase/guanosine-5'-triphosphate,3'-diphosphate pyrophosphatase
MVTRHSRSKSDSKERAISFVVESGRPDSGELRPVPTALRRHSGLSDAQAASLERVLQTSTWEVDHVRQVRQLAVWIFQSLREYHGLGASEQVLLEAGALLHDVGYPIDPADHHKVSARIIRANLGAPFSREQVDIIALLARYHRKGIPRLDQRRYSRLNDRGRRLINWLGGILRVADGLDRSHDSAVGWISTSVVDGRLEVRVSVRPYPLQGALSVNATDLERLMPHLAAATEKRTLLERAIGMPVVIRSV